MLNEGEGSEDDEEQNKEMEDEEVEDNSIQWSPKQTKTLRWLHQQQEGKKNQQMNNWPLQLDIRKTKSKHII